MPASVRRSWRSRRPLGVQPRPVRPAVVVLVPGLARPVGVVGLPELVAAPDHRHAAPAGHDRVREEDPGQPLVGVLAQPHQRAGGPADPLVPGVRVVLEDQPVRPGAREVAGVPVREEAPVVVAVEADRGGVAVVDGPADVVVAAHVRDPGARGRRGRQRGERLPGEHGVAGGEHRPDLHHEAVVVGEVADPAGVAAESEVLHQVPGADDRLRLERERGGRDPGHRPQHLGERVDLGLVLAVGAEPFPHEGDRVEPQHLHADVRQRQDDVGELHHHRGVAPVEVPLPLVEGRPHPALELLVPGEVPGREVREDLRQRRLEGVGQRPVRVDVEVLAVRRVPRPRPVRPVVLTRDVVEDQVHHEADPALAQRAGEVTQVVHRAEVGAHRAVVLHGVPAVVVAVAGLEQRHQVQVGHAEVVEVVEPSGEAAQVVGEPLGVAGVAEHPRLLEPVRCQQPALVEPVQLRRPGGVRVGGQQHQAAGDGVGVRVDRGETVQQVVPPAVQAQRERLAALLAQPAEVLGRGGVDVVWGSHRMHSSAPHAVC